MQLVSTLAEILANCSRLSSYINGVPDTDYTEYALELIRRGTCFLPVSDGQMIGFFPSRFIGYVGNTPLLHGQSEIDGRETNKAIHYILNEGPISNDQQEAAYLEFCEQLGIAPPSTGNFGAARKYWSLVQDNSLRMPEGARATLIADLIDIEQDSHVEATQREQLSLARIGQGKFRRALDEEWNACPLSGCSLRQVLRASHIKPWTLCSDKERLDPMNGLLLSANYDALFDKHLISFDDNGTILIANRLTRSERRLLLLDRNMKVTLVAKRARYMRAHRREFSRLNT